MSDVKKGEGLVYKNHPLRRVDNLIYYGSMADKYIVMFQILESKKEQDMDVATRVSACMPPWMWGPSGLSAPCPASCKGVSYESKEIPFYRCGNDVRSNAVQHNRIRLGVLRQHCRSFFSGHHCDHQCIDLRT